MSSIHTNVKDDATEGARRSTRKRIPNSRFHGAQFETELTTSKQNTPVASKKASSKGTRKVERKKGNAVSESSMIVPSAEIIPPLNTELRHEADRNIEHIPVATTPEHEGLSPPTVIPQEGLSPPTVIPQQQGISPPTVIPQQGISPPTVIPQQGLSPPTVIPQQEDDRSLNTEVNNIVVSKLNITEPDGPVIDEDDSRNLNDSGEEAFMKQLADDLNRNTNSSTTSVCPESSVMDSETSVIDQSKYEYVKDQYIPNESSAMSEIPTEVNNVNLTLVGSSTPLSPSDPDLTRPDDNTLPSHPNQVIITDLDTGEQKYVNIPSNDDTSDTSVMEQVKDTDDEMLSLLNFFNNPQPSVNIIPVKSSQSTSAVDPTVIVTNKNLKAKSQSSLTESLPSISADNFTSAQILSLPEISKTLRDDQTNSVMVTVDGQTHLLVVQPPSEIPKHHFVVRYENAGPSGSADVMFGTGANKSDNSEMHVKEANEAMDEEEGHEDQGETSQFVSAAPKQEDNSYTLSSEGRICCKKCSYSTDKKTNWYKHKIKHRTRQYQCHHCTYLATTSSNLKRHLLGHQNIRNYMCNKCDARFKQKIHLKRHIKYKHEEHGVKCQYCDFSCVHVQPDLIAHIKRKHMDICNVDDDGNIETKDGSGSLDMFLKYKCDECNVYSANWKDLMQHKKFHKRGAELKFFCEYCSFVTECESRLNRHLLTHSKEKPFKCAMCEYRANEAEHVKRHLKIRHKVDVPSARNKKKKKSMVVEDADTTFNLEGIPKKNYPITDIRNSEKHFACNFCTMRFTKLINLFKHVHVQHKQFMPYDNVYTCVVCDYCTMHYKRLLLHMRKMHSTTNCLNTPQKHVYVCMLCNYSSPYRLYLHAHLKKEHNMQMVSDKEGVNKYMLDASKHSSMLVQTTDEVDSKKPGSIIKRTVAGQTMEQPMSKDSKLVLVQLTPDGPMTPVLISMGENENNTTPSLLNGTDADTEYPIMETGITDALHMGCDDDLSHVLQEVPVTCSILSPSTSSTSTVTTFSKADLITVNDKQSADGAYVNMADHIQCTPLVCSTDIEKPSENNLKHDDVSTQDADSVSEQTEQCVPELEEISNTPKILNKSGENLSSQPKHSINVSDNDDSNESEQLQVKSNQVVHLSSGDFVEINGQLFKIEMELNDRDISDKNKNLKTAQE